MKIQSQTFLLAATLVLSASVVQHSAPLARAQESSPKNPLSGTHWTLTQPIYPGLEQPPFLKFTEQRLNASVGCNSMSGSYQLDGKKIKVEPIISTMMGCEEAKMQAETQYAEALQNVTSFELGKDAKTLVLRGKTELSFALVAGNTAQKAQSIPAILKPVLLRGGARIQRTISPEYAGDFFVTMGGKEQKIASKVWNFWEVAPDEIVYAGSDGGGGFENEGHSLWHLDLSTGQKKKLVAEVFAIEKVRAIGNGLLVLSMRDGGLGAPHLNVIRTQNGRSVYRQTGAFLSAVRNGRLAIGILPRGESEGRAEKIVYKEISQLARQ